MADENPPDVTPESSAAPKKETVRITLPPKLEGTSLPKRETVRINLPTPPVSMAPKKESARISTALPSEVPSVPKPFVPPPSVSLPTVPAAASPLKSAGLPPPKPPTIGTRPSLPSQPSAPTATGEILTGVKPVTSPKKETARIQVPSGKPPIPKATIKMQQTQPLSSAPAPIIKPAPVALVTAGDVVDADPLVTPLSWAALVLSLISLVLGYLAYSA